MGIPVVMVTAVFKPFTEETYVNTLAHLQYAVAQGRERGVIVTVETNLSNEQIFQMRNSLGEDLRLCFDTCNPYIYNIGDPQPMLRETLTKAPGFIEHYHVKDTRREEFLIGRPAPILMGKGDSGIEETAGIVIDSGFSGWVHSESYYFARPINEDGDFYRIAREDCAAIKRIFRVKR
jgi:sugar phosphate isomerase/epimerase